MPKRPTKDPKFSEVKHDIALEQFAASVKGAFQDTDDPRQIAKTKYPFWFLMLLFLCGYLSGCNTVSDNESLVHLVELFASEQRLGPG